MPELTQILSKLSIKELGRHLSIYADLYVKPLKSWRKAFTYKRDGYDFIIYNIIYYFIIVLLIVKDYYLAIPITLLEVVITIIPHLVFYPSLRFFTKYFNKRVSWKQQFRLILILKFQFIPILVITIYVADLTGIEDYYLFLDNFIYVLWFAILVATPLLVRIAVWKKAIWIIANYFSFILFIVIGSLTFESIDIKGKLTSKLSKVSPSKEYLGLLSKSSDADIWISDENFMIIGEINDSGIVHFNKTQFVSLPLALSYYETLINQNRRELFVVDSILCSQDSSRVSQRDSIKWNPDLVELTKARLDSFRLALDSIIGKDILFCKSELENVKFESNRSYLKSYHSYLDLYYRSYKESKLVNELLENSTKQEILALDKDFACRIYKVDINFYNPYRREFFERSKVKEDRLDKSMIIARILLFPIF